MDELSFFVAFIAGIVSFLSPCVLPIIPGFLAYLSGSSFSPQDVLEEGAAGRRKIFFNSVLFVFGFSAVFAVLGVLLNTVLEAVAYDALRWLSRIGGAIIIFFGLYLAGIIKIAYLERPHTMKVRKTSGAKYVTSFLFGAAFAVGWTPCVGAALGAILGLAASQPGRALYLLFSYALGLGIPFLMVGFFASRIDTVIAKISPWLKYVNAAFGILLVALGILVFTQTLNYFANFELLNKILLQ